MEQVIIENIERCQSLNFLAEFWKETIPNISKMPEDQAAKIIQIKDMRKDEIQTGIYRWLMDSKILGTVDVVFDTHKPDQATVDGSAYSNSEMEDLHSRNLAADDILMIHQVKQEFEGTVKP